MPPLGSDASDGATEHPRRRPSPAPTDGRPRLLRTQKRKRRSLPSKRTFFAALFAVLLSRPTPVLAENRTRIPIDVTVDPGDTSRRIDAVIHGNGYLDLSELDFESVAGTASDGNLDDGAEAIVPDDDQVRKNGAAANTTGFTHVHIVDVAVFGYDPTEADEAAAPPNRNSHIHSKRLGDAGIGATGNDGLYYVCCTQEAQQARACLKRNYGRLIVQSRTFEGGVVPLTFVDEHGRPTSKASFPPDFFGTVFMQGTGHASVLIGNCNPSSPQLRVTGNLIETSYAAKNNLPFYVTILVLHLALVGWYRYLMQKHSDERIRLEEWIFVTISIAAVDMLLHTTYEGIIASADHDVVGLDALAVITHSAKHGLSRCLYVMVSMGWGVVRETLQQQTMYFLYFLGIAYAVSISIYDIFVIFGIYEEGQAATSFMINCYIASYLIDIVFIIWIPVSLNRTMAVLRMYRQERKLERYKWLWRIFIFAVAFSMFMIVLFIIDSYVENNGEIDGETLERSNEVVYLTVLASIAYLWQPNPNAKLYSNYNVMEPIADDEDDDGHVLRFEANDEDDDGNGNDNDRYRDGVELTGMDDGDTADGYSDEVLPKIQVV